MANGALQLKLLADSNETDSDDWLGSDSDDRLDNDSDDRLDGDRLDNDSDDKLDGDRLDDETDSDDKLDDETDSDDKLDGDRLDDDRLADETDSDDRLKGDRLDNDSDDRLKGDRLDNDSDDRLDDETDSDDRLDDETDSDDRLDNDNEELLCDGGQSPIVTVGLVSQPSIREYTPAGVLPSSYDFVPCHMTIWSPNDIEFSELAYSQVTVSTHSQPCNVIVVVSCPMPANPIMLCGAGRSACQIAWTASVMCGEASTICCVVTGSVTRENCPAHFCASDIVKSPSVVFLV